MHAETACAKACAEACAEVCAEVCAEAYLLDDYGQHCMLEGQRVLNNAIRGLLTD